MIQFNIDSKDFLNSYFGKQPKIFKNAIIDNKVTWAYINEMLQRSDINQSYFHLSYDGVVPKSEYVESYSDLGVLKHRFIRPILYNYLRNGATLTANRIVNEPIINSYARQIEQFTGFSTICSAYIAFGEKSSFRPHCDSRDIFVLQTVGKKRWIIYPPSFENPLYMHKSLHMSEQYPCSKEPILDIELEAGDILYLPRGFWHDPLPLGQETVHLTIAIYPPSGLDYIEWLFNRLSNIHEIDEIRQNLLEWEIDKEKLNSLAKKVSDLITDQSTYNEFMQEFIGEKRVESNLALELLGNGKINELPMTAILRLNFNQSYGENDDFIIANGVKLTLDNDFKSIILYIANHSTASVSDIFDNFKDIEQEKLMNTLYGLCLNDIVEVVGY